MNRLFNLDNPFFTAMSKVADLFILNIVFVICCIPIVTIGPAMTALFYVTMKMARDSESYIIRSFFHSFKQNLKQGILVHLILMLCTGIIIGDYMIIRQSAASYVPVYRIFLMALTLIFYFVYLYIYPILAKFENSIKNTFRNSLLMSIRHLPQTILILIVSALPIAILLIPDAKIQAFCLFALILLGPSGIAYANSTVFVRVFDNYIPAEKPITDDDFDPNKIFPDKPEEE